MEFHVLLAVGSFLFFFFIFHVCVDYFLPTLVNLNFDVAQVVQFI